MRNKNCAVRVEVGDVDTDICLTKTQRVKIFGARKIPKPIACGAYACVYPHSNKNKLIKISTDDYDAHALNLLQGLPNVVKVYEQYKLKKTDEEAPTGYVTVVERLAVAPEGHAFRRRGSHVLSSVVQNIPCSEIPEIPHKVCRKIQRDMDRLRDSAARRGVELDDLHGGNIGYNVRTKRWQMIDGGYVDKENRKELPVLAGARKRR